MPVKISPEKTIETQLHEFVKSLPWRLSLMEDLLRRNRQAGKGAVRYGGSGQLDREFWVEWYDTDYQRACAIQITDNRLPVPPLADETPRESYRRLQAWADAALTISSNVTMDLLTLDDEELSILEFLDDTKPVLQDNYRIDAATHISRKTVGARLPRLIEFGLVFRPEKSKRKGVTITTKGSILRDQIRSKKKIAN